MKRANGYQRGGKIEGWNGLRDSLGGEEGETKEIERVHR